MAASVLSPTFVIGYIRIGSVEGASCVNMGNNYPSGFTSHKKHNQGFGNIGGDGNTVRDGQVSLNDSDLLDMFNHADVDVPDWIKKMIADSPQNDEIAGG